MVSIAVYSEKFASTVIVIFGSSSALVFGEWFDALITGADLSPIVNEIKVEFDWPIAS